MERAVNRLALAILSAAILGLTGWVLATTSRVSALEATQVGIREQVSEMRTDVRQLLQLHLTSQRKE